MPSRETGSQAGAEQCVRVAIAGFSDTMDCGVSLVLDGVAGVEVVAKRLSQGQLSAALAAGKIDAAVLGDFYARLPEELERMQQTYPDTGIVLLADHLPLGLRMRLQWIGCLPADARESELVEAVRIAAAGGCMHLIRDRRTGELLALGRLTHREWEVLERKERGLPNSQIAGDLHLSVHTVRSHLRSIYEKLGIKSSSELIALKLSEQHDVNGP